MSKKITFNVDGFTFIEEDKESQFAMVEIEAFSSGKNRHDLTCSVELLKSTASTIYYKPIVFEKDDLFGDFGAHSDKEKDRNIAGFVVPNSAEFFERDDGRIGLKVKGVIWKLYANWVINTLKSSDMVKKVSVEMLMEDADEDGNMGNFEYTGVCILGDFYTEASPDAKLELVSFSLDDYKKAYKLEFQKYSEVDFVIPKEVKSSCQDGLDIYEEFRKGGTSVSLAMARYIIKNESISPKKIRKMAKYFGVKGGREEPEDIESKEFVSWQLYGGKSGKEWSSAVVDEMNVADETMVAHFEKEGESDYPKKNLLSDDSEEKEIKKEMEKEKDFEEKEDKEEMAEEEVTMEEESPEAEEMAEDESDEEVSDEEESTKEDMVKEEDDESGVDYETLFSELVTKYNALKLEAKELREFKAGIETDEFNARVDVTIASVKHLFDKNGLTELREESKNYSLSELNGWENLVKAKGFEASEKLPEQDKEEGDGFTKMSILDGEEKKDKSTLW